MPHSRDIPSTAQAIGYAQQSPGDVAATSYVTNALSMSQLSRSLLTFRMYISRQTARLYQAEAEMHILIARRSRLATPQFFPHQ